MNIQGIKAVAKVVGVGALLIGGTTTITNLICEGITHVMNRKEMNDTNMKDAKETVKVLTIIRENYEKKFGIKMFANGDFIELKKE